MAKKVIDDSNLGHLVSKAKAAFWPKEDVININLADVATSGDYDDLSNKPTIPDVSNFITNSVNNLTNYYLKSETYTKEEVAALIGAIQQFHYEIAASTSAVTSPASNVLYLIGPTGSGADRYEEYVYSSGWVKIGDTSIDLSGYVTTTFLSTELAKYATIASLATVATTGSYNDLEDTPSIPSNVVQYTSQNLTDAQKSQARTNIGAGTYSKPSSGIPASDIADGVIPTVPTDMVKYTAQTLTDAQKAQARTNIGATAPEIFWAEYGVTTFAEIEAAINANKKVLVKYIDSSGFFPVTQLFSLAGHIPSIMISFYSEDCSKSIGVIQDSNTGDTEWQGPIESGVEFNVNKVTSWQNTPDNTHYPSEKLVKDSLDAKQPTIDASHKLDYSLIANTPTIPAAPVNADWNATSGLAEILNKPSIPSTYAGSPTAGGFANKAVAIPFGTVDATSTSTVLTATVDNFPEQLSDGVCAYIRNDAVASESGYTLNINGTGALPVYVSNADNTRSTTVFSASTTFLFVYNSSRVTGGCWDIYYGYNSNDNTIGYNLRTNGASAPPASQKYYRYRLLFTSANGQNLVPANTSSSSSATSSKTVNQTKIDPFGVIFYYSYTTAVSASSSPSASYLWMQYSGIALGYSFNRTGEALTMTARDPVYLKCAPQSDGSAIIDADNPIVQALPTTADGKIYIFLGYAESATALTLYYWHPVYYHDGTKIAIWSGSSETNADITFTESNGKYTIPKADIDKLIAEHPKNIKFTVDNVIFSVTRGSGTLVFEFLGYYVYSVDIFFGSSPEEMVPTPHTFAVYPDTEDPTDPTKTQVVLGGHPFTYNATSETYEYDTNNPSANDYDDSVEFVVNKVTSLSSESTDVQYPSAKAVYTALSGKQGTLTFDTAPTVNSTNPVTSGGVYNAITENEEVVAAALNDLNDRLIDVENTEYTSLMLTNNSTEAKAFNLANKDKTFLLINGKPVVSRSTAPDEYNGGTKYFYFTFASAKQAPGYQNIENLNKQSFKLAIWEMLSTGYLQSGSRDSSDWINIPIYGEDEVPQTSFIDYYSEYDTTNYSTSCIEGSVLNPCKSKYLGNSSNFYDDSYIIPASDFVDSSWTTQFPNGVKYLRVSQEYNGYTSDMCWIEMIVYNNCKIVYTKYYTDPAECVQEEIDGTSSDLTLYEITDINTDAYDGYVSPIPFQKFKMYGWSSEAIIFFDANSDVPNIDFYQHPSASHELINGEWVPRGQDTSYNTEINGYACNHPWYVPPTLKSVYDTVHPAVVTSGNSIKPNKLTQLGTITSNTTFFLNTSTDVCVSGKANHYYWTFDTGATAPTITWPSGLTWPGGSAPAILPNKHYEISVLNNIVAWMEV